jgi:hypothetical protein
MIPQDTTAVVVPHDLTATDLAGQLRALEAGTGSPGEARALLRALQPYTVALRQSELERAEQRGWLLDGPLPVWTGPYDPVHGVGTLLKGAQEEVAE